MAKSANLYVQIEPDVKEQAVSILNALGIPASNAITIFYKQIILQNGLPFDVKLPEHPLDVSQMTVTQLDVELEKEYKESINSLAQLPERFRVYDKVPWCSRNLRIMPVEHYLVFCIPNREEETVTIIRVMYGGRDIDRQLKSLVPKDRYSLRVPKHKTNTFFKSREIGSFFLSEPPTRRYLLLGYCQELDLLTK